MKKIFFIFSVFLISSTVNAQSAFDVKKLELGGSFGLAFGKYSTSVKVAPQIGYRFTNMFSAGLGIGYTYYGYDQMDENYAGMNFYARLRPWRYFMIQAQPEFYRTWGTFKSEFVPCFLIGAGVILPIGNLGGISLSLSYDLIQNNRSPYSDELIYSIGYVFNF